MRARRTTMILLTVACAVCAAAIAALPGPGTPANASVRAADIISALSLVPKAVTTWEKAAKEQQRATCPRPVPASAPGLLPLKSPDKHCRSG